VGNELGIYGGQSNTSKHTHRIYDPYKHKVYERTGVYRINIPDEQYSYSSNRLYMKEGKVQYSIVEDAVYSFFEEAVNPYDDDVEENVDNGEETLIVDNGRVIFNPQTESVDIIANESQIEKPSKTDKK
jgi:pyocin large subunit-like protein